MKIKSYQNLSKYIALFAIILALTAVSLALPFVFLIPLLFVAVTFDFKISILTSLFFGLISYGLSFMGGGSFVPLAFIEEPLIPIVPRLFVGITTYFTNFTLNKMIRKEGKLKEYLPKVVAAAVGSIVNTAFVICFMYILLPGSVSFGEYTLHAYTPVMIVSGCIELAINVIVLPPLAISVRRALRLTKFGDILSGKRLTPTTKN